MNMDLVKWLGGGLMLLIWAALVATDRVKNVGAEGLIQFIQYSLVGLGAHGLTVRRPTSAPIMPATAPTAASVTLPNGDARPALYVPGGRQTGSITAILAIIVAVFGMVLYWAVTSARGDTVLPLNPAVTQANIHRTICLSGWTKGVRPPVAWTNNVKRDLIRARGLEPTEVQMDLYELDHIVSLELGGAPKDRRNLQLQRWRGADGAIAKDKVENTLHRRVCSGQMTLASAQLCIYLHWQECV